MVMNRQSNREIGGTGLSKGMNRALRLLAGNQEGAEDQGVPLGAKETVYGFFRAADDWLVIVEGGVEHHRDAGEIFKRFDKLPVTRIGFSGDCLQAASAVDVSGCRNFVAFRGLYRIREGHERRGMRFFEIVAGGFGEDGRRERTKDFAMFDAAIENFFHFRTTRIGNDAAITECARSPFGTALKPAQNFSIGNNLRSVAHKLRLGEFGDRITVTRKGTGIDGLTDVVA